MNKIKLFSLASIFFIGGFLTPNKTEAKIVSQWVYQFDNGCIGTRTLHSTLFGLYTWETFEWVSCPPGVNPPADVPEWEP
ncbi:hypothetical protein [Flavobacterium sp.]|uniref:hypothetical protein n=1 Tax=Flavobacterium sp. TaxID=239 RepID=UPI0035AFB94F